MINPEETQDSVPEEENAPTSSETPLLDELEKGPWPSFVTEMKRAAEKTVAAKDLLRQLERSYKDKIGHWKHGGIVGVQGLRRRRHRPLLRPARRIPRRRRIPHLAGQPAVRLVLHDR